MPRSSKLFVFSRGVQYGEGPQLGVWFGVAIIARLMLRNEDDEERALKKDEASRRWGM